MEVVEREIVLGAPSEAFLPTEPGAQHLLMLWEGGREAKMLSGGGDCKRRVTPFLTERSRRANILPTDKGGRKMFAGGAAEVKIGERNSKQGWEDGNRICRG